MSSPQAEPRAFDGIICIGGEDWWYHNRGHFDFQIMRRLARKWPVLFVNSLGVRMPSATDGVKFIAKIGRKLKSLKNGIAHIENKFWVCSPLMMPGATGIKLSSWALAPQVRMAASMAGIKRPLLWVHCPAGATLLDDLDAVGIVMQRTDRFEAFPEAEGPLVAGQISMIKSRADLVVYAAGHLLEEERGKVRRSVLVTHGVDLEDFAVAGRGRAIGPVDVALLKRPRVGFIGGIDSHTFDPELFVGVARALPDVSFVLVGGCSLPEGWCPLPNVHAVGRKPYKAVSSYMAACDVLIMPWNDSDWIKACNPIKLKEYLAVGRPIVTTDFPALDGWRDLVAVADGPEAFANAIKIAFGKTADHDAILQRLASETWDVKVDLLRQSFSDAGFKYVPHQNTDSKASAAGG